MLGDINFNDYIVPSITRSNKDQQFLNETLALVVYVIFMIIMATLVKNLLIGLAVGNIEAVQHSATLERLAMKVEVTTDLEARMPKWLAKMGQFTDYKFYPNQSFKGLVGWIRKHVGASTSKSEDDVDTNEGIGDRARIQYLHQALARQSRELISLTSR